MLEKTEWTVGMPVIVFRPYGRVSLSEVASVLKQHVTVAGSRTKYRKSNGSAAGEHLGPMGHVAHATPELLSRLQEKLALSEAKDLLDEIDREVSRLKHNCTGTKNESLKLALAELRRAK